MQQIKGRFWGFICYPESMPSWEDIKEGCIRYGYPITLSPLHDKDIDENGKLKKPHYHGIIVFTNTTTENYANKVVSEIFNATRCVLLGSPRSMYLYHTHEGDSSKFHYSDLERIFINGFDINNYYISTDSEVLNRQIECDLYVRESGITEYCDLVFSLLDNADYDRYKFVTSHSIHYNALLKSIRCKRNGVETY